MTARPPAKTSTRSGLSPSRRAFFDAAGGGDAADEFVHADAGDGFGGVAGFGGEHVADGFGRAGCADGEIPAGAFVVLGDALDFGTGGGDGRLEFFFRRFLFLKKRMV